MCRNRSVVTHQEFTTKIQNANSVTEELNDQIPQTDLNSSKTVTVTFYRIPAKSGQQVI